MKFFKKVSVCLFLMMLTNCNGQEEKLSFIESNDLKARIISFANSTDIDLNNVESLYSFYFKQHGETQSDIVYNFTLLNNDTVNCKIVKRQLHIKMGCFIGQVNLEITRLDELLNGGNVETDFIDGSLRITKIDFSNRKVQKKSYENFELDEIFALFNEGAPKLIPCENYSKNGEIVW